MLFFNNFWICLIYVGSLSMKFKECSVFSIFKLYVYVYSWIFVFVFLRKFKIKMNKIKNK